MYEYIIKPHPQQDAMENNLSPEEFFNSLKSVDPAVGKGFIPNVLQLDIKYAVRYSCVSLKLDTYALRFADFVFEKTTPYSSFKSYISRTNFTEGVSSGKQLILPVSSNHDKVAKAKKDCVKAGIILCGEGRRGNQSYWYSINYEEVLCLWDNRDILNSVLIEKEDFKTIKDVKDYLKTYTPKESLLVERSKYLDEKLSSIDEFFSKNPSMIKIKTFIRFVVIECHNEGNNEIKMSLTYVSEELKISIKKIRNLIKSSLDSGVLQVNGVERKTNTYSLNWSVITECKDQLCPFFKEDNS